MPDIYTIYIGSEDVNENRNNTQYSELRLTKYGMQLRKVGYNKVINFLYGIDFGRSKGYYSFYDTEKEFLVERKNQSSIFLDVIVGVNLNLTKNIQGSLEFQYGLIGARGSGEKSHFQNRPWSVTSFSVYAFLW